MARLCPIRLTPYLRRQVHQHDQEENAMKKLIETLGKFGIEVPEDKKEDVRKALAENYSHATL